MWHFIFKTSPSLSFHSLQEPLFSSRLRWLMSQQHTIGADFPLQPEIELSAINCNTEDCALAAIIL